MAASSSSVVARSIVRGLRACLGFFAGGPKRLLLPLAASPYGPAPYSPDP